MDGGECRIEGTATEYFSRITDNKLRRARNGQPPLIIEQDCLDEKRLLSEVLHPDLENTPFALDYGDLLP